MKQREYFTWHAEASSRLQDSKTVSLKVLLQTRVKNMQEGPKTKDSWSNLTPSPPLLLYLVFLLLVLYLNCLPTLARP